MTRIVKSVPGTESQSDEVVALASKALGYPRAGVQVGGGRHVPMPATWDGIGETPPGWTKQPVAVYVASPADAQVPVPDDFDAELRNPVALARLTGPEQGTLLARLAMRQPVDLDNYIAKGPSINAARIAMGLGAAVAAAAAAYEIANQLGLFN